MNGPVETTSVDEAIVRATQAGLPRVAGPYHAVAESLGVAPEVVIERMRAMMASGAIRRIGVVPNHYRLGLAANGRSVWDGDDARLDERGMRIRGLPGVSPCYRRPRRLPAWRYNLFAMVHGRDRAECEAQVREIAALLGGFARAHDVLFSTRVLKKTGLRFA